MAYVDTYRSRNKTATITVVAALHIAAGYALVTGLVATVFPPGPPPPFVAKDFPLDPPTPQPAASAAAPLDDHVTVTRDPIAVASAAPIFTIPPGPSSTGTDGGVGTALFPTPTPEPLLPPTPRYTPRGASPHGNPARWVSPDDYPPGELRRGHEGVTRFRLGVSSDGKVTSCSVTGSSGFPLLDAAACSKLTTRAKFKAATDANGDAVAGNYASSVLWDIPDE